jgi:hypothetical protein
MRVSPPLQGNAWRRGNIGRMRRGAGQDGDKTEMAKRMVRVEDEQQAKGEPLDDDEESRVDCVEIADEEMRWDIGGRVAKFFMGLGRPKSDPRSGNPARDEVCHVPTRRPYPHSVSIPARDFSDPEMILVRARAEQGEECSAEPEPITGSTRTTMPSHGPCGVHEREEPLNDHRR